MTTGENQAENPADGVFQEVDGQFDDLEREYNLARGEIASTDAESADPLEASNARFELMAQVASLQAEVSRQRDELDERDRMLGELGDKIAGFEADIAENESIAAELQAAHQNVLDERREQARLSALLDARAAEREELAAVAQRFQNERDHIQELLETSISRFDEAEVVRLQLDDKVRHLEAARDTAAHEHDARAHELVESRAEMSKLADRLEELTRSAAEANERAEKNDALAERRANESGYLNRRIEALNEKLTEAQTAATQVDGVRKELTMAQRTVHELERDLATERSESAAARAAVESLADRTSDYDELTARVAQLTQERDAAWEAASGQAAGAADTTTAAVAAEPDSAVEDSLAHAARDLIERARELSGRRSTEAEAAAAEAEARSRAEALARAEEQALAEATVRLETEAAEAAAAAAAAPAPASEPEREPTWADPDPAEPDNTNEIPVITLPEPDAPQIETPQIDTPQIDVAGLAALPPPPAAAVLPEPQVIELAPESNAADVTDTSLVSALGGARKRTIFPAELEPNTPEAVSYLLGQPGVIAIVDARSTCGRTGIRPSDLFDRVAQLRDHFDVPVEVVVTPVSTPVGGAPDLPNIGVHQVTGADTVADRVRALCMGFPADQPLVVVAGDDHVRRAAIGEEANVLEPTAVMGMTGR